MNEVKIRCLKCGETILVDYHTSLGHASTDEALAIDRTFQSHKCKAPLPAKGV